MMSRSAAVRLALTVPLLALLGCSTGGDSLAGGASETGNAGVGAVRVETHDAPPPDSIEKVVLQFTGTDARDVDSGWIALDTLPRTVDFLELVNGRTALLADTTAPVGDYSQIRLLTGDSCFVVANGRWYPLAVPSGAGSGLRIDVDFTVHEDCTALVYIDFDASRSLVPAAGGFVLQPSLKGYDGCLTGRIAGTVRDTAGMPVKRAEVVAQGLADTVATLTDGTGGYVLTVRPGAFHVTCMSRRFPEADTSYSSIEVLRGAVAEGVDFVLR